MYVVDDCCFCVHNVIIAFIIIFFYRISFETLSPSPTQSGPPHRVRFDCMCLATRILLFRSISSSSSAADGIIRYSAAKKKQNWLVGDNFQFLEGNTNYIILHYRSYWSIKTIELALWYNGGGVVIDNLDHGLSSDFSTIIFLNDVLKSGLNKLRFITITQGCFIWILSSLITFYQSMFAIFVF